MRQLTPDHVAFALEVDEAIGFTHARQRRLGNKLYGLSFDVRVLLANFEWPVTTCYLADALEHKYPMALKDLRERVRYVVRRMEERGIVKRIGKGRNRIFFVM